VSMFMGGKDGTSPPYNPTLLPQYFEERRLRDYFAASALSALIAPGGVAQSFYQTAAIHAYRFADAMIEERAKKK